MSKRLYYSLIGLSILSFIGQLLLYPSLPGSIPIHWDSGWQVNGYAAKWAAIPIALLPLAMVLLMKVLPKIDPRRRNYDQFGDAYAVVTVALCVLLIAATWLSAAVALGVEVNEISQWRATYRYAPSSARKARLIAELISGRPVQDALDVLKFEHRRAASMIRKVLESAVANADEAAADVEHLYINEARVDGAGRRIGTKGWIAKDRGRAHSIRKEASHIHVSVTEE